MPEIPFTKLALNEKLLNICKIHYKNLTFQRLEE